MTQPRSTSRDLTDEEYLRECTLRNPAFVTALRDFRKRWPFPPSFPPSQVGLRIEAVKQYQAQERAYLAELVKFCNDWPSITPSDVIGGASTLAGPKVRLAPYSPVTWPHDGSLLLCVHRTATGDEVKQAWQGIKKAFFPGKRIRRGEKALKLRIYDLYVKDNKTFREIANQVKKPLRTVAYLFGSVCKDIPHPSEKGKKRLDLTFDHKGHFATCSTCLKGRLCPVAEQKLGLKEASQREIPFEDISEAEKRKIRSSLGRKLRPKTD